MQVYTQLSPFKIFLLVLLLQNIVSVSKISNVYGNWNCTALSFARQKFHSGAELEFVRWKEN